MTTAIIGTGGIGSAIVRQLAAGGETLEFPSADKGSAQKLASAIGGAAVGALEVHVVERCPSPWPLPRSTRASSGSAPVGSRDPRKRLCGDNRRARPHSRRSGQIADLGQNARALVRHRSCAGSRTSARSDCPGLSFK